MADRLEKDFGVTQISQPSPMPVMPIDPEAIKAVLARARKRPKSLANALGRYEEEIQPLIEQMIQAGEIRHTQRGWLELSPSQSPTAQEAA